MRVRRQLGEVARGTGADAVVFDASLSPSQVRNLEKVIGRTVLDRTDLVLEIFSRRAKSKEAKLQVELARLTHRLSRLHGRGRELSRLGGGVGTRGPGEQEVELRRRLIKKRIHRIKEELEEIKRRRRDQRKRRENAFKVALVGYTNAGKSTLMKALTGRDTLVADMLFATLDTKTSSRSVSQDLKILFTDTVGFIKNLPPELVESFKATLEEVTEADALLHVVDVSDRGWLERVRIVEEILGELGADGKPTLYVLNKVDLLVREESEINYVPHAALVKGKAVVVSAGKGWGIDRLVDEILKLASVEKVQACGENRYEE